MSKSAPTFEKLKEKYYGEQNILDSSTESLDGAINLHISKAIEEKIMNGEKLTPLDYEIFNAIVMLSGDTGIINKKGVSVRYPPKFLKNKWDKTKSSPYAPTYHMFMERFVAFSIQNDIVKDQAELHNVLGLSGHSLEGKLRNLLGITESGEKTESVFKIDEDVLNRWYVRIRNSIENKFPNTKATLYGELDEIFDPLFRAFGYEYHHPLYRSAKLMLAEIGDILVDAKSIESNSIRNINRLIKGSRSFSIYQNLKESPNNVPKIKPSEDLLKLILEEAPLAKIEINGEIVDNIFNDDHKKMIENLINGYIEAIVEFGSGRDLLKGYPRDTYRKKLLHNIIDKSTHLQRLPNVETLSKFLFGKDTGIEIFLATNDNKDQTKPRLDIALRILLNSRKWTVGQFNKYHIQISENALSRLKGIIAFEVFKWVEDDEYSVHYMTKQLSRTTWRVKGYNNMWPEYGLVKALWLASVYHEENPNLSFKDILTSKYFGDTLLTANLRKGNPFLDEKVKNIILKIKQWAQEEAKKPNKNSEKLEAYEFALRKLGGYVSIRHLKPFKARVLLSADRKTFFQDSPKAYHVILGLARHLGFDPGYFQPIDDKSFHLTVDEASRLKILGKKVIRFIRHHFRDDPAKASSLLLEDQILIDARSHSLLEITSEADILAMTTVLENLIKFNRKIDQSDIRNEFRKLGSDYLWIGENWINQRSFDANLNEFNIRKEKIKSMPIDKFIEEFYPKAYNRFYVNILQKHRGQVGSLIQRFHKNIDISGLLTLGKNDPHIREFTQIFSEILKDYNYPIYF